MVINTILFSGSNPSLGPKYNVKSTRSLNMQKYQKELTALLDETTVNDSVTLREYLQHRLSNNTKEVTKIHDAYEPGELRQGERIINLTFRIEGQPDVTLKDLRYFKLSGKGYTAFKDLMQKNGSTQSYDPNQAYDPQKAK